MSPSPDRGPVRPSGPNENLVQFSAFAVPYVTETYPQVMPLGKGQPRYIFRRRHPPALGRDSGGGLRDTQAMATIFYTGSSLDGFIADPHHDLSWLVTRDIDVSKNMGFDTFEPRIGASIMGATTWQWLLDHGETGATSGAPSWVLSHRSFAPVEGVTFAAADDVEEVRRVHAAAAEAAGDKDVWLIGGGGLVAQFVDAGLVDELWVQFAPVTLGAGAPLLPMKAELRLEEVVRNGDFVCTRYAVL